MKTLQIGQRIDVWEVLSANSFAKIPGHEIKVGQHLASFTKGPAFDGVWINSIYGECYHYPVEGQLKKVGTLVIKSLKCHICGGKAEYKCEKCEEPHCETCQAPYNQFSQIDYDCCESCYNSNNRNQQ